MLICYRDAVPTGRVTFATIPATEVAGYFHLLDSLAVLLSLVFLRELYFRSSHRPGIGSDSSGIAISIRTFAVHNLRGQSSMFQRACLTAGTVPFPTSALL